MSQHNSIPVQPVAAAQASAVQSLSAAEPVQADLYKEALQHLSIQRKLSIGAVGDPLEQEADAMADTVMRMPETSLIQRKCADCEEEEKVQRSPLAASITPFIQTKGGDGGTSSDAVTNQINSTKGSGSNMDSPTQSFMENRFGTDFSNVKIHTGDDAVQMSRELNAQAFTVGSDIYFNSGKYNPASDSGKHLLAHELTHTVQQGGRVDRKIQKAENDTRIGCSGLTDTMTDINTYVNAVLASLRPSSGAPTASAMISGIRGGIGSDMFTSPGRTQIEGWADSLPASKAFLPAASATKYSGASYVLWATPFRILNPTMKVNDICIGSDKLGHFFQQGHDYYVRAHGAGGSVAAAVSFGQSTEEGGYGLGTTGVYSNADLEANRRGLDFYDALAASPSLTFDISTYVNANWSEVNNPNFYESSMGTVVWRNLLNGAWKGSFGINSRGTSMPVSVTLTPGTGNTISGTYTYGTTIGFGAGAMSVPVSGTISGTITYNSVTPPGAATTAVSGIKINFTWMEGLTTGKGVWNNVRENNLTGTWGLGASDTNGGLWDISK